MSAATQTPPPAARGLFRRTFSPAELGRIRQHSRFAAGLPARLTAADYEALWSLGLFRDQKTHLLRGVIYQEPPMNPPHAAGVRRVCRVLNRVFAGFDVRCQLPVDVLPGSRPLPDAAVVDPSPDDYATAHPTVAHLIVEVADETLFDDTTTKAELYASAGIVDYWVLDVANRRLLVFRDPAPLPADLGTVAYRTQHTLGPADTVSPLAAPTAVIKVADLLP